MKLSASIRRPILEAVKAMKSDVEAGCPMYTSRNLPSLSQTAWRHNPYLYFRPQKNFSAPHCATAQLLSLGRSNQISMQAIAPAQHLNPALLFWVNPAAIPCCSWWSYGYLKFSCLDLLTASTTFQTLVKTSECEMPCDKEISSRTSSKIEESST